MPRSMYCSVNRSRISLTHVHISRFGYKAAFSGGFLYKYGGRSLKNIVYYFCRLNKLIYLSFQIQKNLFSAKLITVITDSNFPMFSDYHLDHTNFCCCCCM